MHAGNSFDVYLFGTPTSTPETAYRFAIGETIKMSTTGKNIKISKPLNFLVVADHAEMVGSIPRLFDKDTTFTNTKTGNIFKDIGGDLSNDKLQKIYELITIAGAGQENQYNLTRQERLELKIKQKVNIIGNLARESMIAQHQNGTLFLLW